MKKDSLHLWNAYLKARSSDSGHKAEFDALVIHYLPIVKNEAIKVREKLPSSVELDDLISSGTFGLFEAIERFDPERGVRFETFASKRIRGAMYDEMRQNEWVPRAVRAQAKEIDEAQRLLEKRLGRPPSDDEVAAELGWTERKLALAREKVSTLGPVVTLDAHLSMAGIDNEATLADMVATPENLSGSYDYDELMEHLADAMDDLTERQKAVLSLYYLKRLKFSEIGNLLGVSESRICQIHISAIDAIRASMK
jgi:RNA polymerase sigma factor for flagellar operon FliA